MPVKSARSEIYDSLAEILATTHQEKIALTAFKAMRDLNPRGALFVVKPKFVEDPNHKLLLDEVADQIYRDLDRGIPYSRIALNLRMSARRVLKLKRVWDALPTWFKDQHRRNWSRKRKLLAQTLEIGRDAGNRRVLLRRPVVSE